MVQVMDDISFYKIPIYDFPIDQEQDDEETIEENKELRSMLPFAIVGADEEVYLDETPVRCRKYPWGIVEGYYEIILVDNPQHSDLSTLRFVLLSSHLQDLKEITQDVLYEKYRTECLSKEAGNEDSILREQDNK